MTIDYFPYTSESRDISLPAPMVNELLETYKKYHQGENVKIKVVVVRDVPPPNRAHPTDAGLDLYAAEQKMIHPHETQKIPLGVKIVIPTGYVGLLVPRSSLGTRGLGLANDVGVIDADYRGELAALVQNRGRTSQVIRQGDKICQLLITPITTPEPEIVTTLPTTERGIGGFGSTGRN